MCVFHLIPMQISTTKIGEMFFVGRINPNNGYATKKRNNKIAFHAKKMRTQDRLRAKLEAKK